MNQPQHQHDADLIAEIEKRHADIEANPDAGHRFYLAWADCHNDRTTLLRLLKLRPAPLCLVCGASAPCMTETDLKEDDPGVPCTFEPLCVTRAYENGFASGELKLLKSRQPPVLDRFQVGSRVRRIKGYKFEGRVNGTFPYFDKPDAPPFVNVQHDDGWVMHFRENELESLTAPSTTRGDE